MINRLRRLKRKDESALIRKLRMRANGRELRESEEYLAIICLNLGCLEMKVENNTK